jgi:hypothetical protein
MNLLGAPASRRPVGNRKPELVGEMPALPGTVPWFKTPMRVHCWRSKLPQIVGSFVLNDPEDTQPNSLVVSPINTDWCEPELRHNNGRSAVGMRTVMWK